MNTNTPGRALTGTTQFGSSKNRNAFEKQQQSLARLRNKTSSTGILISAAQSTAQPAISHILIHKDKNSFHHEINPMAYTERCNCSPFAHFRLSSLFFLGTMKENVKKH